MTPIVTALMGLFILAAPQLGSAQENSASSTAALPSYQVTLTAYNAVPDQTDSTPLTTASGAYSNPNVVAARSQDLADELPFGTVIEIEPAATSSPECGVGLVDGQIGLRVIADSMNAKMHNKVDVLLKQDSAARTLGLCPGTKVVVVGHIDISDIPQTQAELAQMMGGSDGALASAN